MPANLSAVSDEFWEQQAASEANAAAAFSPSNQSNGTLEIPVGASPSRRAAVGAVPIDKWQPVAMNFTIAETGARVLQIDWTSLQDSSEGKPFYTLWYRNAGGSERNPRCLTSADSFSSTDPISNMVYDGDGCRVTQVNATSASGVEYRMREELDRADSCTLLSKVEPLASERSSSHLRLRRKLSRHRRSSIVVQMARVTTDELAVNASRPDAGVPEPTSHPVSMSMRMSHSLKESLAADFLDRYAHLFDAYIHVC
jgi:hypothetical protein